MRQSNSNLWRVGDVWLAGVGILTILILSAAVSVLTAAQTAGQASAAPPASGLTFEVASIKPNKSGDGRAMVGIQPGGRFTTVNVPARLLIRQAYQVQEYQLVGAPDWTRTENYDITAKASIQSPSQEQLREMQQALLAERFQFQAHRETRELPIYALMPAHSDGRLGPGLKPSPRDCDAFRGRGRGGPGPGPAGAPDGPGPGRGQVGVGPGGRIGGPPGPPDPSQPMQFGMRIMPGRISAGCMSISQIANTLTQPAGRLVQDKSGLTGDYDLELSFTPEFAGGGGRDGGPGPGGADFPAGSPSLFTAIQEQAGLKLDSQRAPVEVLVIDRMERPTPD